MRLINAAIPIILSVISISDLKNRISLPPGTDEIAFPLPEPPGESRGELAASSPRWTAESRPDWVVRASASRGCPSDFQAGSISARETADNFPEPASFVPGQIDE